MTTLRSPPGIAGCWTSIQRNAIHLSWPALAIGLLISMVAIKFTITINMTPSLPFRVAIIERGSWPQKVGDLLAYRSNGTGPVPAGIVLIKRVVGMPGDSVVCEASAEVRYQCIDVVRTRSGLVTRQPVRHLSRSFHPLERGPVGVIPDMHFHVGGDHQDSFDSRYALMGWIRADQVVGKVVWSW